MTIRLILVRELLNDPVDHLDEFTNVIDRVSLVIITGDVIGHGDAEDVSSTSRTS